MRAGNGGLQQGAGNSCLSSQLGLILTGSATNTHVGVAGVLHNRGNVCKVQVDECADVDQIRDTLGTAGQHAVSDLKGVLQGDAGIGYLLQTLVGDDDQRIHVLAQLGDTGHSLIHTALALESKGLGYDTDGQNTHLVGQTSHNGSSTRTGTAAHTGGDEYHVGVLQNGLDLFNGLLGSAGTALGIGTGTEALGQLLTNDELGGRIGMMKGLTVRVDGYELYALDVGIDHTVDRIITAATDTDHFNVYAGFISIIVFKGHCFFLPILFDKSLYSIGGICSALTAGTLHPAVFGQECIPYLYNILF